MINYNIDGKIKVKNAADLFGNLPKTILVNSFDEQSAKDFESDFNDALQSGQSIIPIVIDSYGGQVYSLLNMIDVIKSTNVPVATIVKGKAMSCGAILFSCGTEGYRFMAPNSTLMIHDVSSFSFGKVEEIKSDAKESDRLNEKIYHLMASNTSQPKDYFMKIVHELGHADWYLYPEDAVKHKLANHIRLPKLDVNVSVNFDFR